MEFHSHCSLCVGPIRSKFRLWSEQPAWRYCKLCNKWNIVYPCYCGKSDKKRR